MEADEMKKFLQVLDKPSIMSREQFMIECIATGLECDDKKFDEIVEYEVSQLKNFKHIESMFAEEPEKALFTYKQIYHLVESAGFVEEVDVAGCVNHRFKAIVVNTDQIKRVFNMSVEFLNDIVMMHGIDPAKEVWTLTVQEVLKR